MSDLLADLQVDRRRETPPAPAPAPRGPALELRLSPLHWQRPRVVRTPGRVAVCGGPWDLALVLA